MNNIENMHSRTINQFMEKHFEEISKLSPLHQRSFFKYLYKQIKPLAESSIFQYKILQPNGEYLPFKHNITKSAIDMSQVLCSRLFNKKEAMQHPSVVHKVIKKVTGVLDHYLSFALEEEKKE